MVFRFGDCELREELFELRRRGQVVAVEPKVLQLLLHLVRNRARAVTRTELLSAIWGDVTVGSTSLTRAVVEARKAIGDESLTMIETVRGHGFRFTAPVTEVSGHEPKSASAPFAGREAPMAALGAQLDHALAGKPAFAWVTGVAGIGKTRMLEELAVRARDRSVDVHVARCHESLAHPAFRPWTAVLSAIGASDDPAAGRARETAAELAERGGDIAVFERITSLLAALGATRPRLFAFDDLHWADVGTLDLLRFVARELATARVFVIGTLRDTASGGDARSHALGRLLCEYGAVSIPLRGLTRDDTSVLIRELKGVEPSSAFTTEVHARTGGCPLFVHQILETDWARAALEGEARSLATSIDMKRGLVDSVGRHLDGASPGCRDLLGWAAVIGREFNLAVLGDVAALDTTAVIDRIEEAKRGHLVRRVQEGEYVFVHPLVADVLYQALSASERAARHRTVGAALERRFASSLDLHAVTIARHYVRAAPAGSARPAFEFCARAARTATTRGDLREATRAWTRAMRMLDLLPASEAERLDVLVDLARVHARAGDVDRARSAALDAAMLARALERATALAETALLFAEIAPSGDPRRRALLDDAKAAVERAQDPRAEALTQQLERASRA